MSLASNVICSFPSSNTSLAHRWEYASHSVDEIHLFTFYGYLTPFSDPIGKQRILDLIAFLSPFHEIKGNQETETWVTDIHKPIIFNHTKLALLHTVGKQGSSPHVSHIFVFLSTFLIPHTFIVVHLHALDMFSTAVCAHPYH